jgi:hypothetical protein
MTPVGKVVDGARFRDLLPEPDTAQKAHARPDAIFSRAALRPLPKLILPSMWMGLSVCDNLPGSFNKTNDDEAINGIRV